MAGKNKWKYCVIGNIVKSHVDDNGKTLYGTAAFSGGTKVYLCGKLWTPEWGEISVIGLTRGKRYQVIDVLPGLIENVRKSKAYNPAILEIMQDWEFRDLWWDDSEEDKQKVEEFVARWNSDSFSAG